MNAFARLRTYLVRLGFAIGRLRPVRSRAVLATSHAEAVTGNLVWIRAGLRERRADVEVRELAHRVGGGRRRHVGAAWHSLQAGYLLATSRLFVVDDYFFPMYVITPRPGTTFAQVWHACGAFKKFGYSVVDKAFGADEAYATAVRIHSNYDVCLVSSTRFVPAYAEAFRLPPARFTARLGIPRTDLFFDEARVAATVEKLRRRYRIPADRRVVLYAPTFRGDRITRARDPEGLDLAVLQRVLGDDHVVLMRSHPFVRSRSEAAATHGDFVIDVSDHPDMNELLLAADVLVTDYSSAMYEFALLGRPIGFLAPDHAAYEAERGFYFEFAAGVPGPIFTSSHDLAAWLARGEFDVERVRRFADESFDAADGRATARFVDEVAIPALDGAPRPAVDGPA